MDIYTQNIIDHYKNPHNKGKLKHRTISHKELNQTCGDDIEVDILLTNNKIQDLKYRSNGCAISQASISMLTDEIIGMKVKDVLSLKNHDVHKMLSIPISERRQKCAGLGLLAIQNAIKKIGLNNKPI